MYKGEGYKNKVYDYQAKDVTALCGGECQIRGSMHGKHISTIPNLVGNTGCAGSPGLHILIKYDIKHYKMVGINIKDAKASSTPKAIGHTHTHTQTHTHTYVDKHTRTYTHAHSFPYLILTLTLALSRTPVRANPHSHSFTPALTLS